MALFAEVAAVAEVLAETASRLKKRAAIEAAILRVVGGGGDYQIRGFAIDLATGLQIGRAHV